MNTTAVQHTLCPSTALEKTVFISRIQLDSINPSIPKGNYEADTKLSNIT